MQLKTLLLAMGLLGLVACSTVPPPVATKTTYVKIPVYLLSDCVVVPPPNLKQYLSRTLQEREGMLSDVLTEQYTYVGECNIRLEALRDLQAKQLKLQEVE